MKKVILAVVVIAILGAGIPFYAGIRAQQELDRVVDLIDSSPAYAASWQTYNKGWLTTQARLVVSLDLAVAGKPEEKIDIPLDIAIDHGPLISDEEAKVGWFSYAVTLPEEQSEYLKELVETKSGDELLSNKGYVDLSGTVTFRDQIQAFVAKDDGFNIDYAGYSGKGTVSSSGLMVYGASSNKVKFSADDSEGTAVVVDIDALKIQYEADFGKLLPGSNLMPSKAEMTIPAITVTAGDKKSSLNNSRLLAAVELPKNSGTVDIKVVMSVASGQLGDKAFSNAVMDLGYNNISLMLMDRYVSMMEEMVNAQTPDPDKYFSEDVLREAISHTPEFVLNKLEITLPEGAFNGNFTIKMQEVDGVDPAMLKTNPMAMINGISIDLLAQMDKGLAEKMAYLQAQSGIEAQLQAEKEAGSEGEYSDEQKEEMITAQAGMTLQMLIGQGLIVEENGRYQGSFQFKKGETLINGKPSQLPLGAMMGM